MIVFLLKWRYIKFLITIYNYNFCLTGKSDCESLHYIEATLSINAMDGPPLHSITGVSGSADEDTWTPLHWSAYVGDHQTVVELLRQGDSVSVLSSNGRTPLMLASLQGHDSVVSALLAHTTDADIDVKDNEGRTALHHATDNVHASIVELLMERRADMDTVDVQGFAPLHMAIANNSLELVRCFLNAGANVNIADPKNGFVGLHIAAQEGFCDIMELLLDHADTDINVQNIYGYTPLHSAAYCNRPDAVKMLLQRGADVRKTTDEGYTPIIAQLWTTALTLFLCYSITITQTSMRNVPLVASMEQLLWQSQPIWVTAQL